MKIFLTDQTPHLVKHLSVLKSAGILAYEKKHLKEKTSSVLVGIDPDRADLSTFFNYQVFPGNILTFMPQWQAEGRAMQIGDTIVQQVYIPPVKSFSQKIIFGVRICEIINEGDKKGFSYETLKGHVEKGISTFTLERTGSVTRFTIHTFSKPGNLFSKLLGPVFSVPYQAYCTRAALNNVKHILENN